MSQRFYLPDPPEQDRAVLAGSEAHHVLHVLRARVGDELTLFDGRGVELRARIERLGRSDVECVVLSRQTVERESSVVVTLAVALPKGDRQSWLIEKAVELGVASVVPLETARGVAQPLPAALERLRRTVIEASKQCGRNRLMTIAEPQPWSTFTAETPTEQVRWIAHPGGLPLSEQLTASAERRAFTIAVGPEGGFTDDEVALAERAGWQRVGLGPRILRIETAAVALAAVVIQNGK